MKRPSQPFTVLQINVAGGHPDWRERRQHFPALFQMQPDIITAQEVTAEVINDLLPILPEGFTLFEGVEIPRNDFNIVVWSSRFRLEGRFSAHLPLYDGQDPRAFTGVQLYDTLSNRHVVVYSIHLDHVGRQARMEGLVQIFSAADIYQDPHPVIVSGDYNFGPQLDPSVDNRTEEYAQFLLSEFSDAYYTLHADEEWPPPPTMVHEPFYIDIVAYRNLRPLTAEIIDGRWSDHKPVLVQFEYHRRK